MVGLMALALLTGSAQEDFFPLKEGTVWTYKTHAGREFVKRVLGREKVGGAECTVLQLGDLEKHWLTVSADGVRVHRSKGVSFDTPLVLFKFPLTVGERWEGEAATAKGAIRYSFTSAGVEEVEVPAGRYRAFRIDWTIAEGGGSAAGGKTWLARGVGPVKESYGTAGRETGLELCGVQGKEETYYPLAKGYRWTYRTDYDENTDIIHEVTAAEKVGDVECLVMEYRTRNEKEDRTRTIRKEWLAAGEDGVKVHKVLRGISTYPVEAPFFKLKSPLKKGDEWKGVTRGTENPPRYHTVVEEESEVEVPAGKFKVWKVKFRIESGERHAAEGYEWYARNVGLVKSEMTIHAGGEDVTIGSELKEFKGPAK